MNFMIGGLYRFQEKDAILYEIRVGRGVDVTNKFVIILQYRNIDQFCDCLVDDAIHTFFTSHVKKTINDLS